MVKPRQGLTKKRGGAGQGLPEYALILALIGVAAILGLTFLGGEINNILSTVGNAL
jgi:Flp pilus assembly pilin Flp